jgi:hypothetical protein
MSFLEGFPLRPVQPKESHNLQIEGLILGQGAQPLEVILSRSLSKPAISDLRAAWRGRRGGRAAPLLFVVLYGDKAAICGPSGEQPAVFMDIDPSRAERICRTGLDSPDRHTALRFLHNAIPEIESPIPGLRNEGLFATHELVYGIKVRPDWSPHCSLSLKGLPRRGRPLLEALGFNIDPMPGPACILRSARTKIAIAVLLERQESADVANPRFLQLSPVSYALAKAEEENLPYVIIVSGPTIRLHPVRQNVGVGRRGRTETYVELNLDLLEEANIGLLTCLFSADALQESGPFAQILDNSSRFAADLGDRLRSRVHSKVIPPLAEALIKAQNLKRPSTQDLVETYKMALLVLFRILFVAYAEDKDLLPFRSNDLYRARSLKQKAHDLIKVLERGGFGRETSHWEDVLRIFRAVDKGAKEWGIPPYNGGLFSLDPTIEACGARLEGIKLQNDVFGPVLADLLVDETPEGRGPVDFRSLGVREFGTIYEGLLENELSLAETNLTVDKNGLYRPVRKKSDDVVVPQGHAYLHNASGARKATGSYFRKDFAVDHLLDHALEPALKEHIDRLDGLKDDREAAVAFFDFRVADIAMGSGHFLVSAIDRIERVLSGYLARRRLPPVFDEIGRLRAKSATALGSLAEEIIIEDNQLLRRQIARRCIYGVDINSLAVQLARLSIWIHTFVPGLPLSFLDHNLVEGNSLVGIATVKEAEDYLREAMRSLFSLRAEELIGSARESLSRLAALSDADSMEVELARKVSREVHEAVHSAEALFNIISAARIDDAVREEVQSWPSLSHADLEALPKTDVHELALNVLSGLCPFHFPIAFPEVFLGDRAGFDVILGNPPWEEATVEEDRFWTRYVPGFHSLRQHEQEVTKKELRKERPDLVSFYESERKTADRMRRVLTNGPFPGMGTGDPDLYKAFAWRFWNIARPEGGKIGVVLPRPLLNSKGSQEIRKKIFEEGKVTDLTTLLNNKKWVFDDVHPQYTIALFSAEKKEAQEPKEIYFRGPYRDLVQYKSSVSCQAPRFVVREVMSWTDTAALPLLPDDDSTDVFAQLRKSPRLDMDDKKSWLVRPYAELHATIDKHLMALVADQPKGFWPVFKGESFDIWTPDTGTYYAWGDPKKILDILQAKRIRARTSFLGFQAPWLRNPNALPCLTARIAFRDITNRTNRRTVIAALVPRKVFLTNKAPYFLWPRGDEKDQAYLLGVLCSIPLDWYARRFVEVNLNFFILNPFPIPRPTRVDPLWERTVALAGRLACTDKRFDEWAKAVGVACGKIDADEKEDMINELDAVAAHLYGLTEKQLVHVYETFHEGWDYSKRLAGVLKHFRSWRRKS